MCSKRTIRDNTVGEILKKKKKKSTIDQIDPS